MHATSAKAGPDLRCAPGWRRFASGFAEHRKIAETQRQTASRTSPHHIIGRCCANPIAAVVPAGHRQPHAFPIGRTQPPRLPPCEVFQRGPTQAQPPPSRRGPHRKTFTNLLVPIDEMNGSYPHPSLPFVRRTSTANLTRPGPSHPDRARSALESKIARSNLAAGVNFSNHPPSIAKRSRNDRRDRSILEFLCSLCSILR